MSNVTLQIGGRRYTVACADEQEAHIIALGQAIDAKLASTNAPQGQAEVRELLFAALLMADENHELRQKLAAAAKAGVQAPPDAAAPVLEAIADRLEKFAARLESGPATY